MARRIVAYGEVGDQGPFHLAATKGLPTIELVTCRVDGLTSIDHHTFTPWSLVFVKLNRDRINNVQLSKSQILSQGATAQVFPLRRPSGD